MNQDLSWTAWNRRFEQWEAAKRKHADLKVQARLIATTNLRAAAIVTEAAALQWRLEQTAEKYLRVLMVALRVTKT